MLISTLEANLNRILLNRNEMLLEEPFKIEFTIVRKFETNIKWCQYFI